MKLTEYNVIALKVHEIMVKCILFSHCKLIYFSIVVFLLNIFHYIVFAVFTTLFYKVTMLTANFYYIVSRESFKFIFMHFTSFNLHLICVNILPLNILMFSNT